MNALKTTKLQPVTSAHCYRPTCNYEFTEIFNIERSKAFKTRQLHYETMRSATIGIPPKQIAHQTRRALKKHDEGTATYRFNFPCPKCFKRVYFTINTLHGDVARTYEPALINYNASP